MKFFNKFIISILLIFNILHADTKMYYGQIVNKNLRWDNIYPISMKLTFNKNKTVQGYYFYNKWKTKIHLSGEYTENNLFIKAKNETFTGTFSKAKIKGTWSDGVKNLVFYAYSKQKVNPFKDKELTCEEMESFPELIFDDQDGIDLGSGHGSPLSVDYSCDNSLSSLGFLDKLLSYSEQIRSEGTYSYCTGSIVHAQWRYYHFNLLKVGIAPEIYSNKNWAFQSLENSKKYFSVWGHSSLTNFKLYSKFWKEYEEVFPLLVKHYEKTFLTSNKKATFYTENGLSLIIDRGTGHSSNYYNKDESVNTELDILLQKQNISLSNIETELNKKYSQTNINKALRIAILYKQPNIIITSLLNTGAEINIGNESALFFAAENINIIKLLLKNGANINYANAFGKTVLYYAIENHDLALVKLLIDNGANVNHEYIDNKTKEKNWGYCSLKHTKRTPLMHAAQNSNIEILKYLISKGAKKNAVDEIKYNVLDYAYMEGKDENIDYLESIGLTTTRTSW